MSNSYAITKVSDKYAICLKTISKSSNIHRTLILTLDYSGSMNGAPFVAGRS